MIGRGVCSFPGDNLKWLHGIAASAFICVHRRFHLGRRLCHSGRRRAVLASRKWNHRFTQTHADDCNKPGRQMRAATIMSAPKGRDSRRRGRGKMVIFFPLRLMLGSGPSKKAQGEAAESPSYRPKCGPIATRGTTRPKFAGPQTGYD